MIPADDKVKNGSPIKKSPNIELGIKVTVVALIALLVLSVSAVLMVWKLVNSEQVKRMTTTVPTRTKIVSNKDLAAYTLLTKEHLILIPGTNETADPKGPSDLLDRYLLSRVLPGTEIKPDMLAPPEANALLGNSVAVSIPATATATMGSQLRVGDMIDLLAIPGNQSSANQSAQPKPPAFENLLVLNVPIKKDPKPDEKNLGEVGAITLALPAARRDEFAFSIAGATIVITRRVSAK